MPAGNFHLCASVSDVPRANHALSGDLASILQADKKAIFTAASKASEARPGFSRNCSVSPDRPIPCASSCVRRVSRETRRQAPSPAVPPFCRKLPAGNFHLCASVSDVPCADLASILKADKKAIFTASKASEARPGFSRICRREPPALPIPCAADAQVERHVGKPSHTAPPFARDEKVAGRQLLY